MKGEVEWGNKKGKKMAFGTKEPCTWAPLVTRAGTLDGYCNFKKKYRLYF